MKLKHKQNIENKEHNFKKKTFVGEIFDGINKKKQIELEEKIKIEEEKRKIEEEKIRLGKERIKKEQDEIIRIEKERKKLGRVLLIIGFIITTIGFCFGKPDSGLQTIGSVGFIGCIAGYVLLVKNYKKKK